MHIALKWHTFHHLQSISSCFGKLQIYSNAGYFLFHKCLVPRLPSFNTNGLNMVTSLGAHQASPALVPLISARKVKDKFFLGVQNIKMDTSFSQWPREITKSPLNWAQGWKELNMSPMHSLNSNPLLFKLNAIKSLKCLPVGTVHSQTDPFGFGNYQ